MQISSSEYAGTTLREALIESIALAVQTSATNENCYPVQYIGILGEASTLILCKAVQAVEAVYFIPAQSEEIGQNVTRYFIHSTFEFSSVNMDPVSGLSCNFTHNLTNALATVVPDFVFGGIELGESTDIGFGGGVNVSCVSMIDDYISIVGMNSSTATSSTTSISSLSSSSSGRTCMSSISTSSTTASPSTTMKFLSIPATTTTSSSTSHTTPKEIPTKPDPGPHPNLDAINPTLLP